jgi:hypothetical protein
MINKNTVIPQLLLLPNVKSILIQSGDNEWHKNNVRILELEEAIR